MGVLAEKQAARREPVTDENVTMPKVSPEVEAKTLLEGYGKIIESLGAAGFQERQKATIAASKVGLRLIKLGKWGELKEEFAKACGDHTRNPEVLLRLQAVQSQVSTLAVAHIRNKHGVLELEIPRVLAFGPNAFGNLPGTPEHQPVELFPSRTNELLTRPYYEQREIISRILTEKSPTPELMRDLYGLCEMQIYSDQERQDLAQFLRVRKELPAQNDAKSCRPVLEAIAASPHTPNDVLEKVSLLNDEYVLQTLAANPNTPAKILDLLQKKNRPTIDVGLALNPKCKADVYNALAKKKNEAIQVALSTNPSVDSSLKMKKLPTMTDIVAMFDVKGESEVPCALICNLRQVKEVDFIYEGLPKRSTPELVWLLLESKKETERAAVVYNNMLSGPVLRDLSLDPSDIVKRALASNLATPGDVLSELSRSKNVEIVRLLARNPICPSELARLFLGTKMSKSEHRL